MDEDRFERVLREVSDDRYEIQQGEVDIPNRDPTYYLSCPVSEFQGDETPEFDRSSDHPNEDVVISVWTGWKRDGTKTLTFSVSVEED